MSIAQLIEEKLGEMGVSREESKEYDRTTTLVTELVNMGFLIADLEDPEDYSQKKFEFGLWYVEDGEDRVEIVLWPYVGLVQRYTSIYPEGDAWMVRRGPLVDKLEWEPSISEKMSLRHGAGLPVPAAQYDTKQLLAKISKWYSAALEGIPSFSV